MVMYMVFKNIKMLREDRDITQQEIARYLHIAQNTYSQYETGKIALTADVLIRLAQFYGTSVDYLLDLTDETLPYKRKA